MIILFIQLFSETLSIGEEALNKIETLCLDKTGTLTKGEFEIVNVIGEDKDFILSVAAALEQNSTHPLSKAFLNIHTNIVIDEFEEISGDDSLPF